MQKGGIESGPKNPQRPKQNCKKQNSGQNSGPGKVENNGVVELG
jgi:hypothetical protein